ncbi:MAG: bacteriophage abortive infection AbiH family protein [Bacteroidales bacterium]|nr:bacteriophage abortive infection AbiH family protein [Bacteroidales bacterium]
MMKEIDISELVFNDDCLVIVGNGFDLAHGIKSSYSNLKSWLSANKFRNVVNDLNYVYGDELWSSIEEHLSELNPEEIFDSLDTGDIDIDDDNISDHLMREGAIIEDSTEYSFCAPIRDFYGCFRKWVDYIDMSKVEPIKELKPINGKKFLTFNYTETLEEVYKVPRNKILHIHGSRLVKGSDYVFGHNRIFNTYNKYDWPCEEDSVKNIHRSLNLFYKDVDKIIKQNSAFFSGLQSVKKVIVLGSSIGKVDMPYFDQIHRSVNHNIPWIFSYHSDKDMKAIEDFISRKKISDATIFCL